MSQLGDTLSDERRRQGKSLVDIEAATKIRGRLLEALEHGDYDQLPAPAYVKGYIQSYAKYLDIPAQPLLEMYKVDVRFADEREAERDRLPKMPRGAGYSKVSRQDLGDLPSEPVVPKRDQQHAIPMRTWLFAAGGILTVFVLIWAVSAFTAPRRTTPPVPKTAVQETVTPDPAASPTTVASTAVTPVEPTAGEAVVTDPSEPSTEGITPVKLTFRIRPGEISSLRVTVDGELVFSQKISKTEEIPSFDVYDKATIVIGKPIWVTTFKDGERIPTPNEETPYTLEVKNDKEEDSQ